MNVRRKDLVSLQDGQLIWSTSRAEYLQLFHDCMDVRQVVRLQYWVQDLRKTQSLFSSNNKAKDLFAMKKSFCKLTSWLICGNDNRGFAVDFVRWRRPSIGRRVWLTSVYVVLLVKMVYGCRQRLCSSRVSSSDRVTITVMKSMVVKIKRRRSVSFQVDRRSRSKVWGRSWR